MNPAPARVGVDFVMQAARMSRRAVQGHAAAGKIPSAAKLGGRDWTFDPIRIRLWIAAKERECLKTSTAETASITPASKLAVSIIDQAYEHALS